MASAANVDPALQVKFSPEEQKEIDRMNEELRNMDPEAFEKMKAEYEQQMMQMQNGGGGAGGEPASLTEIAIELIARGVSNSVMIGMGAPFMRISVLSSIQHELVRQGSLANPYLGVMDCANSLIEKEGWKSLFRGVLLDIGLMIPQKIVESTVIPITAAITENLAIGAGLSHTSNPVLLIGFSLSSVSIVQLVASAFLHPIEIISQKYQTDIKKSSEDSYEFTSGTAVAKKVFAEDGILGFYTGFGLSALSLVTYKCCYFFGYEMIQKLAPEGSNPILNLALGVSVALSAMAITHPLDVVRQRMNATAGTKKKYPSAIVCAQNIIENEGAASLWSGLKTRIIFAIGATIVRIPMGM